MNLILWQLCEELHELQVRQLITNFIKLLAVLGVMVVVVVVFILVFVIVKFVLVEEVLIF